MRWTTVRYGDCTKCGPAQEIKSNGLLYCGSCQDYVAAQTTRAVNGKMVPLGEIERTVEVTNLRKLDIPARQSDRTGKCSAKCRTGKKTCDCHCGGRCHGAGDACYCLI